MCRPVAGRDCGEDRCVVRLLTVLCRAVLCCAAGKAPISVDEVEDAAEIMKRFCTGGMSLGAISREVRDVTLLHSYCCTVTNSVTFTIT